MKGTHEIIEKSTLWLFEVMLLKKGIVSVVGLVVRTKKLWCPTMLSHCTREWLIRLHDFTQRFQICCATCKATPLESIRIEWQLKKFLVPFPNYMKWNFQGSLHQPQHIHIWQPNHSGILISVQLTLPLIVLFGLSSTPTNIIFEV